VQSSIERVQFWYCIRTGSIIQDALPSKPTGRAEIMQSTHGSGQTSIVGHCGTLMSPRARLGHSRRVAFEGLGNDGFEVYAPCTVASIHAPLAVRQRLVRRQSTKNQPLIEIIIEYP